MPSRKKASTLNLGRWLFLLPIPALWCALSHLGLLTFLENKSVDWRFHYRGELAAPVNIVHVNVDSLSLSAIGGMPWSRTFYAQVAEALLTEAKVKAIGFDFVFSDSGLSESVDRRKLILGNRDFGVVLNRQPPVVLAAAYGGWQFLDVNGKPRERALPLVRGDRRTPEQFEPPEVPSFETSPDPDKRRPYTPPVAIGLIDTMDGATRAVPAWAPSNEGTAYFHMAAHLARLYWGLEPKALSVRDGALEFTNPDGSVRARVPLRHEQFLDVNWFTRWRSPHTQHVEFAEVFEYAEMLRSEDANERSAAREFFAQPGFKDSIVLVGPVDPLLQDMAPTSLDPHPVPKVGVHGNLLKTIITGQYLQRVGPVMTDLLITGLALVVAALSIAGGARTLAWKFAAALVLGLYVVIAFQWFSFDHVVLPLVAPVGAALSTSLAGLGWQVVLEQRAKGRIKGMFGTYVSPQLVDRMVESGEDPQLGGHDAEITAYFSDIQGFSSFSEKLGSGPLVELMNEYLSACTDIVQAQGGTLDKYIGDAVVAMFGAPIALPDHAYRACVASQLVQQRIGELRAKWKGEGDRWPAIVSQMQSRIGLNTGVCMIGNMGSTTRFNYTMMGDNVNLAARMESGAKSWGVYTMVTEATRRACEQHGADRVVFRALGRIVVLGRSQPVPIFEIAGLKESLPSRTRECIGLFETGLAHFHQRDWDRAAALFRESGELEANQPGVTPGVKTNPSQVFLALTERYRLEPPAATWAGEFAMTEK